MVIKLCRGLSLDSKVAIAARVSASGDTKTADAGTEKTLGRLVRHCE